MKGSVDVDIDVGQLSIVRTAHTLYERKGVIKEERQKKRERQHSCISNLLLSPNSISMCIISISQFSSIQLYVLIVIILYLTLLLLVFSITFYLLKWDYFLQRRPLCCTVHSQRNKEWYLIKHNRITAWMNTHTYINVSHTHILSLGFTLMQGLYGETWVKPNQYRRPYWWRMNLKVIISVNSDQYEAIAQSAG